MGNLKGTKTGTAIDVITDEFASPLIMMGHLLLTDIPGRNAGEVIDRRIIREMAK